MPGPHFSHRTEWEFRENALTRQVQVLRAEGRQISDWTLSNPTVCGFPYDRQVITGALTDPSILTYAPEPAGLSSARQALARFLSERNIPTLPERLLLTASTSEAYAYLFRLLCNSGENVVVPKPGYPLCEELARLNDVSLRTYRSHYVGSWHVDEQSLRDAVTSTTRAIVVIHPNNPAGNYLSPEEQQVIARVAREYDLALVADEVFLTFPFQKETAPSSCASLDAPLVFVLNGLSKMTGLPQVKLGWIGVHGDPGPASDAMRRLEMIADSYLSVNTPVQAGLPALLQTANTVGENIRTRVSVNYASLRRIMEGSPITVLHAEAGWSAVMQLPRILTDEAWALHLLVEAGLLVYPGHFFDLDMEGCVAVSLLPVEGLFSEYAGRLRGVVEALAAGR